jgi:exopolysaccharide biosynthesis polyprenyl glycosylphosphotransferase
VRSSVAVRPGSRDEAAVGYQWLRKPRRLLALFDGVAAGVSLVGLYALTTAYPMPEAGARTAEIGTALVLLLTMIVGFRNGQYTQSRRLSRIGDSGRLFSHLLMSVCIVAVLALITKGFFYGSLEFSRLLVAVTLCVFFLLAALARFGLATRQRAAFMQGMAFRKVLVLGSGQAAGDFIHFLAKRPWLGVASAGRLEYRVEADPTDAEHLAATPHCIASSIKGLENLDKSWVASGASEVVVALDPDDGALLPDITKLLTLAHVPFRVVPSLFEESYHAAELMGYAELPVIDVDVDPLDRVERAFKRTLDLAVSTVVVVLGFLPGAALAAAIKLDSPGPVFYKQERIGRNGRHFLMYKFRTMFVDADARIAELAYRNGHAASAGRGNSHAPSAGDGAGNDGARIFKIKDDPRITRLGRVLRKWSLDEFPQIINVYRGEMSLVGPRPPLPREVENYESQHYVRLKGLPGMTGLWQVSGRSDLSFEEMVKLDRYYLDNWSLRLDLSIMLRTFVAVLTRDGAY